MRNLVVRLMDGEEVLEEKMIKGEKRWMERYEGVVRLYTQMMTNDNLTIRINTVYD